VTAHHSFGFTSRTRSVDEARKIKVNIFLPGPDSWEISLDSLELNPARIFGLLY
jgi:hypothetical protein